MDVLQTQVPAVMIPFAADGETEQALRARRLAERGHAVHLPETDLSARSLLTALDQATQLPGANGPIRLDGAPATVSLVAGWIQNAPQAPAGG